MKYKIGYYIIDENSITIMFYESMFLGQSNVPSQLYIGKNDYRYDIIKTNLLKQPVGDKEFDSEWFQIPALKHIEELSIDDFGNVSYHKSGVSVRTMSNQTLKNLIDYWETPIYEKYLEILRYNNWFFSKDDSDTYTVVIPNLTVPIIVFTSHVAILPNTPKHDAYCAVTFTPYVASEYFESKEPNANKVITDESQVIRHLTGLVRGSLEKFDKMIEDFWKCSIDEVCNISDNVKNNNAIFEKFINKISNSYDINPDVIPFIASNITDVVKLNSLLLTGMIQKKSEEA